MKQMEQVEQNVVLFTSERAPAQSDGCWNFFLKPLLGSPKAVCSPPLPEGPLPKPFPEPTSGSSPPHTSPSSSHRTTASLWHSVPTGRNSGHAVDFATSDFVLLLAADPRHCVKRMRTPGSWNPPPWGRSVLLALLSTKQQRLACT